MSDNRIMRGGCPRSLSSSPWPFTPSPAAPSMNKRNSGNIPLRGITSVLRSPGMSEYHQSLGLSQEEKKSLRGDPLRTIRRRPVPRPSPSTITLGKSPAQDNGQVHTGPFPARPWSSVRRWISWRGASCRHRGQAAVTFERTNVRYTGGAPSTPTRWCSLNALSWSR
jgi:hypothetical protein